MSRPGLRVGIVGCGLMGHKRAAALGESDELVGATDLVADAAQSLTGEHGGQACADVDELLSLRPGVVIVAVTHDQLAGVAARALAEGAHVLVEKPVGLGMAEVDGLIGAAERAGRRVKVGFNHRFHPGLARLAAEIASGAHGELMHIRSHYGHGGRLGYEHEWRAQPERSGGGELVDQGMHLLDLVHWIAGPLPLHSSLLRTDFWQATVEDNAALILGDGDDRESAWAMLHVSWTEWENVFSLEAYCRTAKLVVDGLHGSYGPQRLRIFRMRPELGPPDLEETSFPEEDGSWAAEWEHFAAAIGADTPLLGDLADARYAWSVIEQAYAGSSYAAMREAVLG